MKKAQHTIDAKGQKLGRIASQAAIFLMGKNEPDFQKNQVADITVTIVNASQAAITEKKKGEKIYKRFSGYPGGLKERTMANVIEKKGYSELFIKAIYGMLPDNKLRARMMKNLTVSE
jgi:large subunit ribosomal protein L13